MEDEIIRLGREESALQTQIWNLFRSSGTIPAHLEFDLRAKQQQLDKLVAAQRLKGAKDNG